MWVEGSDPSRSDLVIYVTAEGDRLNPSLSLLGRLKIMKNSSNDMLRLLKS
jgi:hypothetical protein